MLFALAALALCRGSEAAAPALPYLSELRDATASVEGTNAAFSTNPAAFVRTSITHVRQPDTVVELIEPNGDDGYRTLTRLRPSGFSAQSLSRGFALGDKTLLRTEIALRESGRFTRVDENGISIHAFPEADGSVGAGIARRMTRAVSVGATANWLRSKQAVSAGQPRYAHGWAFDVGVVGAIAPNWRVGFVGRNLGNGLSRVATGAPTETQRQAIVGVEFRQSVSDRIGVVWTTDVRMPSKRGAQATGGVTLALSDRVRMSAGYQRLVEPRRVVAEDDSGVRRPDERLWVAEGPTFGLSARVGAWRVGGAVRPTYLPRVAGDNRREVSAGRWQWTVGLSSEI